jgi:DNA-binding XRE family transcriptional regulator
MALDMAKMDLLGISTLLPLLTVVSNTSVYTDMCICRPLGAVMTEGQPERKCSQESKLWDRLLSERRVRKMYYIQPSLLTKNSALRTERKRRGWTQAEVAEALGISTKTVVRWEKGRAVPFPYYRQKLSTLFGKTVQELGLL